MTEFSRRLQRCRQAAGYATPGEFYALAATVEARSKPLSMEQSRLIRSDALIRASESDAAAYFPYLAQSLHGLEAYETVEKGPDTAFMVAEATVRRLLPF